MNAVQFDTHQMVKRLMAAGFSDLQAETVTDVVRDARQFDLENLATKTDLAVATADLRAEIANVRTELKAEIVEIRTELKADIAELRVDVKAEFVNTQGRDEGRKR